MNSVTEELRRLLDERGVEWWPNEGDPAHITERVTDGVRYKYRQIGHRLIVSACTEGTITPEQAITATLGAGECTLESTHGYCDPYVRTAYQIELSCHTLDAWDDPVPPRYCPYCGKRVVKEDE